jgi:starch synthase
LFSDTKIVTSVYSQSFEGSLDAEMINKIKLDGVPLDAISDLESPDYESIIKATIKHSDAVIIASDSLSKFNKIYRIFRKTFYLSCPKMNSRKRIPIFYQERFYN